MKQNRTESFRIIWAITAKDIIDGIKNKSILSSLFSALFLVVFYKGLPLLTAGSRPPVLVLYDAGESQLVTQLENSAEVDLRQADSQESMERYLGSENTVVLGLALPPDFDQTAAANAEITLTGYVDHWASPSAIAKVQAQFEALLTSLIGKPAHLDIHNDTIYTQPDGGQPFFASLSVVVLLFIFGLSIAPSLMLEERDTRTIDALLVSPASSNQVVISKALTGLFYCLVGCALVLGFNAALFVHWGVIIMTVIIGALFHVALGLLVGSLIKNKQQLGLWTMILAQPLLLSVGLMPLYGIMPPWLITILTWLPTVALANTVELSLLAHAPVAEYGLALAYVAGWTAVLLAAVAWVLRRTDR